MSSSPAGSCTPCFKCLFPFCYPSKKQAEDKKVSTIQPQKKIVRYQQYVEENSEPKEDPKATRKIDKAKRKKFQSTEIVSMRTFLSERADSRSPHTKTQMDKEDV